MFKTQQIKARSRSPPIEEGLMDLLLTMLVPLIIAGITLWGMIRRVNVYDSLIHGAEEGLGVLLRIVPALIALLTAVYMLRASGALELLSSFLSPVLRFLGIPPETVALLVVRPVSGSAALGVGAEIISAYGANSQIGRTAAVMLGSTETTFYIIAVYFGAAGIVKSRHAVPAALCADLAGFIAAAWAVRVVFS
jgi:spore maturation protein B